MSGEACNTCKFFRSVSNQGGECRRIPPVMHITGKDRAGDHEAVVRFPQVALTWWCGEWSPRLEIMS